MSGFSRFFPTTLSIHLALVASSLCPYTSSLPGNYDLKFEAFPTRWRPSSESHSSYVKSSTTVLKTGNVADTLKLLRNVLAKPALWILELHHGVDNRLTHTLINKGIMPALDAVEREWRKQRQTTHEDAGRGALIIVGKRDQDKFFSNGLNYEDSLKDPNFWQQTFNPMLTRLLTFPIPTIAAINGHCYAGGFVLAQACDYRVMTDGSSRNAWLCMNEVHFGAPWPLSVATLLTSKYGDTRLHRKIALEGYRFTPSEALEDGIVDYIVKGKTADILKKAEQVGDQVGKNAAAGCWGLIKLNIYRKLLDDIRQDIRLINPTMDDIAAKARL